LAAVVRPGGDGRVNERVATGTLRVAQIVSSASTAAGAVRIAF